MPEPFTMTMATLLASDHLNKMISKQEETNKLIKEQLAKLEEDKPWLTIQTILPAPDSIETINLVGRGKIKYIAIAWSEYTGGAGLPNFPFFVRFNSSQVGRDRGEYDWTGMTPTGAAKIPVPPGIDIKTMSILVYSRSINLSIYATNNKDLLP